MCLINERNEYLFADSTLDKNVYYQLCDNRGHVIRTGEMKVKLETFLSVMQKAGYKPLIGLV